MRQAVAPAITLSLAREPSATRTPDDSSASRAAHPSEGSGKILTSSPMPPPSCKPRGYSILNPIARLAQVCSELLHLSAELRPVATPQRRQCQVIVRGGSVEAWSSIRVGRAPSCRLGRLPGKRNDDVRR